MKTVEWMTAGFKSAEEAEKALEDMSQWARTSFYNDDWTVQTSVGQRVDGFYARIIAIKDERVEEPA